MTREEAIIELKKKITCTIGGLSKEEYNATVMAIEALSADAVEVVRCKDCRHDDGKDLISRADAVEAIIKRLQDWVCYSNKEYRRGLYECKDIIHALPSVSAERVGVWEHKPSKSGEWIWWQCSKCGAVIYSESEADRKIHHAYCGVCGARMENKK